MLNSPPTVVALPRIDPFRTIWPTRTMRNYGRLLLTCDATPNVQYGKKSTRVCEYCAEETRHRHSEYCRICRRLLLYDYRKDTFLPVKFRDARSSEFPVTGSTQNAKTRGETRITAHTPTRIVIVSMRVLVLDVSRFLIQSMSSLNETRLAFWSPFSRQIQVRQYRQSRYGLSEKVVCKRSNTLENKTGFVPYG